MRKIGFELAYVNYPGIEHVSSVAVLSKVVQTIGIGWEQLAELVDPGRRSVREPPKIHKWICRTLVV
jgi:hypothetical protein